MQKVVSERLIVSGHYVERYQYSYPIVSRDVRGRVGRSVVADGVLSALGWYAPLAEFAGCGATVPLLGFGHLLAKGVRTALAEEGAIGILTGGLTAAAAGITTSLVCGVVCSLVGRSHDQN